MKTTIFRGVKVVWKGEKDNKYGYLKLSITRNGKTEIHSLKLRCKKTDFNPKTQRLRTSVDDHEKINEWLDEKVSNYLYVPFQKGKIRTFLSYIQKKIDQTDNRGTKEKYENMKRVFYNFLLSEYKKDDILFEELDSDMVDKLKIYLLKTNSKNTTFYLLKGYRTFVKKLEKDTEGYIYVRNPFDYLNMSLEPTETPYLMLEDLKKLINYKPIDPRKVISKVKFDLNDIKDSFIFSTLSQGLRISDIMTLRWNDFFDNGEKIDIKTPVRLILRKKQFKVKKYVYVSLNQDISRYLEKQVIRVGKELLEKQGKKLEIWDIDVDGNEIEFEEMEEFDLFYCLNWLNSLINRRRQLKDTFIEQYNQYKDTLKNGRSMDWGEGDIIRLDIDFDLETDNLKELYNNYIDSLKDTNEKVYFYLVHIINYLSKEEQSRRKFIFSFLDDKLFENIKDNNDFSKLTEEQYSKFHRKIYINKLLKEHIFKELKLSKNFHFHSARHTYTTLVLKHDTGVSIFDLQKSLGHQSVLTTQKYIGSFYNEKIKGINDNLTSNVFDFEKSKDLKDFKDK